MLWALVTIVVILWLVGRSLESEGGLLQALFVAAVAALVFNLVTGRRRAL